MSERFNAEELALWRALYAAAFVSQFEWGERHLLNDRSGKIRSCFDEAARQQTAERAITIADLGIYRLRQWRAEEEPGASVELGALPKEWDQDG